MDQAHKETDRKLKALEKRLKKEYRKAYLQIVRKADEYFSDFLRKDEERYELYMSGKLSKKEYTDWRRNQLLVGERWNQMQESLANDIVNADKIAAQMIRDELPDIYALNFNFGTYEVEHGTGINTSFTLYDRETVKKLMTDPDFMPSVDIPLDKRWNRGKVMSAMMQGVIQGKPLNEIAKNLQSVTDMKGRAAIRNARTYTTAAENGARLDSYQRAEDLGIKTRKKWIATLDNRTRESHVDLDGEVVDIDEPFSNGLMFPGDPDGDPGEIWNCRCTMVAEIVGHEYHDRRNEDKLNGMTYDEWKKTRGRKK